LLRILITNDSLADRTGAELYTRDLALALGRLGHQVGVLTSRPGVVADELRAGGVPVVTSLAALGFVPDVIHAHHRLLAMAAVLRFPATPALFVCHNHRLWLDTTPLHPAFRRYFGVSQLCVERLLREGVPAERAQLLPNFVDVARFRPRPPLPERPRRALVFSNYAGRETHLPAVQEACARAGLALDVIGSGVGNLVPAPEEVLGQYDLVFAKAKAAMEAMAVGAAVVLCDFSGVGPLVTSAEFERLRPLNFGFAAMTEPLAPEPLLREIARYDAADAARVRDLLRATAGLDASVVQLETIYRQIIAEQSEIPPPGLEAQLRGQLLRVRDRVGGALAARWSAVSPETRRTLGQLPMLGAVKQRLRRAFRIVTWE
jgi:hypothetical protein